MRKNVSFFTMYLMAGVVFFFIGMFIAFCVYPYNILTVSNSPYPIEHRTVEAGSLQTYTIDFCKNGDFTAKQTRVLLQTSNKEFINLDTSVVYSEQGCRTSKLSVKIPSYVESGRYKIVTYIDYQPNFLRTIGYRFETQEFEVI